MNKIKKYGSWSSPISATLIQNNSITYQYLCQDQCNDRPIEVVYWIELRTNDNGRSVIVSRNLNSSGDITWTPNDFSARTRVNEFGGADCFVHSGIVYFSNESDQHLYKQIDPQSRPTKVSQCDLCRYANGYYCGSLETIFIVREDHNNECNVINTIVTIRANVETVLVQGADFYSSPKVSNDGKRLCWIERNQPNMPWDNTKLCVANIEINGPDMVIVNSVVVTTGSDHDWISSILPQWTISGDLCFISDESGYWNLWITEGFTGKTNLTPVEEDIGDPMWSFDTRRFNYNSIRNEFVVIRNGCCLEFMKPDGSNRRMVDFKKDLSKISHCQLMSDGTVVAMAYNSITKATIYRLFENGDVEVLGQSPLYEDIDPKYFSEPSKIKYPVPNSFAYGYFYPPRNPNYCAPDDTLPPLLVLVHGGPTFAATTDLKLNVQYWTSRGYAVFDVDYRGSSGYGKEYRKSLIGNATTVLEQDIVYGVKYLTDNKMVNKDMVAMRGVSAGCVFAFYCLKFTSVFKAASSCHCITDLAITQKFTTKFVAHYLDILVGSDQFNKLSPINYAEKINCPIIFFQGDEDVFVPLEQSKIMFNTIKQKGLPCSFVIYPGEEHVFRKMENIIHNIENEYYFMAQLFGFETPDIINPSIVIENSKASKMANGRIHD